MACLNENVTSYIGYIDFTYTEGFIILLDCKGFFESKGYKYIRVTCTLVVVQSLLKIANSIPTEYPLNVIYLIEVTNQSFHL